MPPTTNTSSAQNTQDGGSRLLYHFNRCHRALLCPKIKRRSIARTKFKGIVHQRGRVIAGGRCDTDIVCAFRDILKAQRLLTALVVFVNEI
jgi:hypothetical protein